MPSIKKDLYAKTDRFNAIDAETAAFNENNDCAVKAVALVCDVTYADAHAKLKELGREDGEPTTREATEAALNAFGFKLIEVDPAAYIADYPGVHKGLRNVTSHHPDRFKDVWADEQTYLFGTKGHVLAVINGTNHDWTRGSAKRVRTVHAVVPKTAKASKYLKSRGAA